MRRFSGDTIHVNSALETISAAATAIASAEVRLPPASVSKRRWGGWWSLYWCFGCQKQNKRISHDATTPSLVLPDSTGPSSSTPTLTLNPSSFFAPPSSPASLFQSESPSPCPSLRFIQLSMSCIDDRPSMFAIGPYAHETQLVSPPVFSTEPSTAPLTPPPETTTPSSPEVPFELSAGEGGDSVALCMAVSACLEFDFNNGECRESVFEEKKRSGNWSFFQPRPGFRNFD